MSRVLLWRRKVNAKIAALESTPPGGGVTVHSGLTGTSAEDCHPIEAIAGLVAALGGKASNDHSHAEYAGVVHGHPISDVSGLQASLDGKSGTSHHHDAAYAAIGHHHNGVYEVAGAVATHAAAGDPHPQYTTAAEAAAAAPVQSVAGQTGAVTLAKGDVGLANVDNTSDAGKPVSTAQQTALNLKANLASPTFTGTVSGITKAMVGLTNVDNTADSAKPISTATQTALDAKVPTTRTVNNGYGVSGGGNLSADRTLAVALSSAQAFATATTPVSAATYADITGASVSLAAGTWLVIGRCNGSSVNAQAIMHVAITDGANAVVVEGSQGIAASGTASVAQLGNVTVMAVVTPVGTTTYKLRAARGLTTITGTWTAMDGAGTNTLNNLTDNSDKGTGIFAVRIA